MSYDITDLQKNAAETAVLERPEQTRTPKPSLTVRAHGLTDRGRVRPSNEDQFLVATLAKALQVLHASMAKSRVEYGAERGYLFVVADGMGGHQAGEQASALAVDLIEQFVLNTFKWFFQLQGPEGQSVLTEFHNALRHTDARICRAAAEHPALRGMGTTVTMAYAFGGELFVVHVGDSRCYLFRDGDLYRLTHDHTLVQELVERGHLKPEDAPKHHWRHVVTNVVGGTEPGVKPEVHKIGLEAGDQLLLCSDGLTEMVSDEEIAAVLRAEADPARACERLVAEANERGGKDNVTVIVARFE
jgi:PPM family protein phosphatase